MIAAEFGTIVGLALGVIFVGIPAGIVAHGIATAIAKAVTR